MSQPKRPRGRPKGSQIDDRALLLQIAEQLVLNPSLRIATALKKVRSKPPESLVRRVQAKWRAWGEALLAEVRARPAQRSSRSGVVGRRLSAFALARRVADSSVLRRMQELQNNPVMKAVRMVHDTPTMKAMLAIQDSPMMKAARAIENSPGLRLIRDIENNPTMRMVRELHDSPVMKMVRDMENMRRRFGF